MILAVDSAWKVHGHLVGDAYPGVHLGNEGAELYDKIPRLYRAELVHADKEEHARCVLRGKDAWAGMCATLDVAPPDVGFRYVTAPEDHPCYAFVAVLVHQPRKPRQ